MKKSRKLFAIALTLLMLLCLSACGMADLPLIKAGLEFTRFNSLHIRPEAELGMNIDIPDYGMNMNVSFTADGEVDYCADPLGFSADLRIKAMDEDVNVLAYGEDVNGDFVVSYSLDGGASWQEQTLGKTQDINQSMGQTADLSLSDVISLGKSLGGAFSGFSKAGQESVNGRSAARYDASFSLRSLMESKEAREAFFKGMAEPLHVDPEVLADMIDPSALEDMHFSLWLDDTSSRLVKAELDLGDLMHSLIGSGLLDSILASEAGLEGIDFSADVDVLRVALSFSEFDNVGTIRRPVGGGTVGGTTTDTAPQPSGTALQVGSTWLGEITISNHAGQGSIGNGVYDVWGVIGQVNSGQIYFEIYDAEDANNSEASPVMSFWAELDGNRSVPVIDPDEQDGWLINIYLTDADERDLVFTLEGDALTASYFYYDGEKREAFDMSFLLRPEA